MTTNNIQSPTEMPLVSPISEMASAENHKCENGNAKVQMKKQLGLTEGTAIILGIIFGSGIFVSPQGVLREVGAVGTSLVIWITCGFLSTIGALCYAELGTALPISGGDYAYINEAYGSFPAFLYLWDALIIFVPTTNAIMGLTFSNYVLQPFFNDCAVPVEATQLLAAATICFLTFINCYDVKFTTKLQNLFMFTKIAALVLVIIVGVYHMSMGNVENFDKPFENTETHLGKLSVAFYSGIFSYAGWNYLNFMTEELREPYKNLPRAIYISLPLVTAIYVLANMAYLAVLSKPEMLASNAIAVTFGNKVLPDFGAWIIPLMVATSAFGGLCVHIMASSRMCFVGARNGHMPSLLAHININTFTPVPSLVFLCLLSLVMLVVSDVHVLITYSMIVESFFIMLSVSSVLYFRYKRPDMHRPIKLPLIIPITFFILSAILMVVPCFAAPYEVLMGIIITVAGIPVYCFGVMWKNKPKFVLDAIAAVTIFCQKFLVSAKEEKCD